MEPNKGQGSNIKKAVITAAGIGNPFAYYDEGATERNDATFRSKQQ